MTLFLEVLPLKAKIFTDPPSVFHSQVAVTIHDPKYICRKKAGAVITHARNFFQPQFAFAAWRKCATPTRPIVDQARSGLHQCGRRTGQPANWVAGQIRRWFLRAHHLHHLHYVECIKKRAPQLQHL
jgi:hypothetical protein